jgi:hypothetical protein
MAGTTGARIARALVFERPYAAALATAWVVATSPFFQMPTAVRQLLIIVVLVPLIRVVRPVVSSAAATGLYAIGFLFAIETLRQAFGGIRFIGQAFCCETFTYDPSFSLCSATIGNHCRESGIFRLILLSWRICLLSFSLSLLAVAGYCAGAAIDARYSCRRRPGIGGVGISENWRRGGSAGVSHMAAAFAPDG